MAEGCYFDQAAADKVCDFIEAVCCHSKHPFAGKPFLLEPWERDWLGQLYGWKRADHTRRFREAFLEIPKKNGKSTLLSALCIYGLFEEPGAEVYGGAVDRSQAMIIFKEAAAMVRASKWLRKYLKVIASKKTIVCPKLSSSYVAMSADVASKDGVSASLTVFDEIHRFKNDELYGVMKYAGAARVQPLIICITTAGFDRFSFCWEMHEKARAILDGTKLDIRFLATIYAAGEADDFDDPKVWAKANPSLGKILSLDGFRDDWREAKGLARLWNKFLRLRLNVWTVAAVRWIDPARWDALGEDAAGWDLEGRECYAAMDLSSTKDLTALALVFPFGSQRKVKIYFFMPEDTAEARSKADKVKYVEWIERGFMIQTEGGATHYGAILDLMRSLRGRYKIRAIAFDPWNAEQLMQQLMAEKFEVYEVRQGYPNLSPASKEFERLILLGDLAHDRNPCLAWNVRNAVVEEDAQGNIKPSKAKSTERIDGLVAVVLGIGMAAKFKPRPKPGVTYID